MVRNTISSIPKAAIDLRFRSTRCTNRRGRSIKAQDNPDSDVRDCFFAVLRFKFRMSGFKFRMPRVTVVWLATYFELSIPNPNTEGLGLLSQDFP